MFDRQFGNPSHVSDEVGGGQHQNHLRHARCGAAKRGCEIVRRIFKLESQSFDF